MTRGPGRGSHKGAEARAEQLRIAEALAPDLEIVRLLGSGQVTAVYLAREPALRRLVAVKVLLPQHAAREKQRQRFQREAQSAARIVHPRVVAIHRVGTILDGVPYVVMQYVRGSNLADRLSSSGPLPPALGCRFLGDIAAALEAAHRRHILHRDIKASNVLYEESTGQVFLTDFGLAAILASGDEPAEHITTAGHIVGDWSRLSPEQLRGEEPTDRADVYGLAVLAYELLSGRGPYDAEGADELVTAHLSADPVPLRSLRGDVPEELEALFLGCLAKDPGRRPSAGDMARRLSSLAARAPASGERQEARTGWAEPPASTTGVRTQDDAPMPGLDSPSSRPAAAGTEATDDRFRLRTLGALELTSPEGRPVQSVLTQPKRVAILAYLAVGGELGFKRRDTLLGVFWPEVAQERGRHALRQALYVLRRALGSDVFLSRGDEELGINEALLACDTCSFERLARSGDAVAALSAYGGDLLPGFHLPDAPEFDRWLSSERLRLRERAARCAWRVAEEREREGNLSGAAGWGRRALELSPFDEGALHRLIELLDRSGDRSGAIRTYEHFARRLAEEYESQPSPETRALIERVRDR